jgi:hypothetical protein
LRFKEPKNDRRDHARDRHAGALMTAPPGKLQT